MHIGREYQRGWVLWSRALAVFLVLYVLDWGGWISWLRLPFEKALFPVQRTVVYFDTRLNSAYSYLSFYRSGAIRLVDAERQLAEYSSLVSEVSGLREENEALRRQVDLTSGSYTFQEARVVSVGESIVVSTSSPVEFEAGSSVLIEDNIVGIVSEVGYSYARVTPIYNIKSSFPARVLNASSSEVAQGKIVVSRSGSLTLEDVPQDVELLSSFVVVTSGGESGILEGKAVGAVGEVLSSPGSVSQRAQVKPFITPSPSDIVFVLVRSTE